MRTNKLLPKVCGMFVVVCATATGCGGTQEEPHVVDSAAPVRMEPKEAKHIEVPDGTGRELQACVNAGAGRWSGPSHAFQYDLSSNEKGIVQATTLRDATLRDSTLEACFAQALKNMRVPDEALRLRIVKPFSGGENMSHSRSSVGIVQAAAAPIALAPIIIPALGVVIIVAISIEIVRNATSGPDCKQVKQQCIEYCSDTTLPTPDFGWKFQKCKNDCLESSGCPRDS